MAKRSVSMVIALCFVVLSAMAQETVRMNTGNIKSPEVNNDGTVTFRLYAPQAKDVVLQGSFLSQQSGKMQNDGKGLWTFTSEKLWPELHTYTYVVDGLRITDPTMCLCYVTVPHIRIIS